MSRNVIEIIVYVHKCLHCHKWWDDSKKASICPKCGNWHIWRSGVSRLWDSESFISVKGK